MISNQQNTAKCLLLTAGALRQKAYGNLRAAPRESPATAVNADQKLNPSQQAGRRGATKAPECL